MLHTNENRLKHRDLNWLSFNERVLQEAEDTRNPLFERIKFLAIFSSNLDEYFGVRVSQLRQIKRVEKSIRKKLALRPNKITKKILEEVKKQQDAFGKIYHEEIVPELARNGIHIVECQDFNEKEQEFARHYFNAHVGSLVKPKLIDTEKEEELFLENNTLYFAVTFTSSEKIGIVNIPTDALGRFLQFKDHKITYLDDIVRFCVPSFFPSEEVLGIFEIKMSRDAELYIDNEVDGELAEKIYASLAQRTDGQPTRLLYDAKMPKEVKKKLRKLLKLGKIDMMPGGQYHNFSDFLSFPDPTNNPKLHSKELPTIKHKVLENSKDYFKSISEKDQAVHF
ncbi:MAG: polyphosphate kinase 1, partial [Gillisia sp.]